MSTKTYFSTLLRNDNAPKFLLTEFVNMHVSHLNPAAGRMWLVASKEILEKYLEHNLMRIRRH